MKLHRVVCLTWWVLVTSFPQIAWASGDEEEDDDFFNFYDDTQWSDYSIMLERCLNIDGKDVVVFQMFGEKNNQCSKRSIGSYTIPVAKLLKAYAQQAEDDAEMLGYERDDPEYLDHLACQGYAVNDDSYIYYKLGCLETTGKNFAVRTYSDAYCTEPIQMNYAPDVDLSSLKYHLRFDNCQTCVTWPQKSYDDDANGNFDDQFWTSHAYESPLCSASWYYKSDCDRKCKKMAKSSSMKITKGFTGAGKFWLLVFSMSGVFFLGQVIRERKKMSNNDALIEEAFIEKVGLEKRQVALMIIGVLILILLFILFRAKRLAWLSLLGLNLILLVYLGYLRYRSRGEIEVGGYRIYGESENGGQPPS